MSLGCNSRKTELVNKEKNISNIELVYQKMVQSRLDRGLEMWPLQDYGDFILKLRDSDWNSFGYPELVKAQGIYDRYYGRGEFVSGYCPKIISYEECLAAVKAIESISEYIRAKTNLQSE